MKTIDTFLNAPVGQGVRVQVNVIGDPPELTDKNIDMLIRLLKISKEDAPIGWLEPGIKIWQNIFLV